MLNLEISCKGTPEIDADGPTVLGAADIEEMSDRGIGGKGGKGLICKP